MRSPVNIWATDWREQPHQHAEHDGRLRAIGCGGVWRSYTTPSCAHTERFILIWVWFVRDLDVLPIVPAAAGHSRDDESGKTNSFTKLENLSFACQRVIPKWPRSSFLFCFPVHYFTLPHLSHQPYPELLSDQQKRHKCIFAKSNMTLFAVLWLLVQTWKCVFLEINEPATF